MLTAAQNISTAVTTMKFRRIVFPSFEMIATAITAVP
jgi:hypothetical protein